MSTAIKHTMPSGAVVFYRDSDHQYNASEKFTRATRVPGASTVSKCDGDSNNDPLIDWGVRLDREGVAREASLGLSLDDPDDIKSALAWLSSGKAIGETLKQEKLTWRDIRQEAGTRGSFSHDVLETLAREETPTLRNGWDHAVADWWHKRQPIPVHVEAVVYSEKLNVAGRFDLMARMDGALVLGDLKTSKFLANSFCIQLNLYRLVAVEAGYPEPERLIVIQVAEDGSWAEVEVPINPDWAKAALATYRAGKEIGKAVRAAKKDAIRPDRKAVAA